MGCKAFKMEITYLEKLYTGIILGMDSANERRHCIVTPPLIGWAHTQNDYCYVKRDPV